MILLWYKKFKKAYVPLWHCEFLICHTLFSCHGDKNNKGPSLLCVFTWQWVIIGMTLLHQLTESGTYPQLPTQPKFLKIVQTDQLSNIVTLNCLAKKNRNLNLRKNVQCSTENGDLLSFQDTNLINFQY